MTTQVRTDRDAVLYVPEGFTGPPVSVADVIRRTAALVHEEGRWATDHWFHHQDQEHADYAENPFCNGWTCCLEGAVQLVTIGLRRTHRGDWRVDDGAIMINPFYVTATRLILTVVNERFGADSGYTFKEVPGGPNQQGFTGIPQFNDHFATRTQVVEAIEAAVVEAERRAAEVTG